MSLFPERPHETANLPGSDVVYKLYELTAEDEAVIFRQSLEVARNAFDLDAAVSNEVELVARSMLPGVEISLEDLRAEVRCLSRENLNLLFDAASSFNGLEYTRNRYEDLKDLETAKKS